MGILPGEAILACFTFAFSPNGCQLLKYLHPPLSQWLSTLKIFAPPPPPPKSIFFPLSLLHSEHPKLPRVLAVLSANGLEYCLILDFFSMKLESIELLPLATLRGETELYPVIISMSEDKIYEGYSVLTQ